MEEINNALAALITQATTGVEAATDFLIAETPEVVVQLLNWNFYINLIWFGIGMIGVSLLFTAIYFFIHELNKEKPDEAVLSVCGAASLATFIYSTFTVNLEWLKIWVAPKVWLIEYAAKLL
jgi:hypothetical protein